MKHVGYSDMVFVLVGMVVLTACRPEVSCHETMKTGMVCEYRESYLDETEQVRYRTSWDSLTVVGIGKTDSLYANEKNVQKINLPLRSDIDSTQYSLTYHNLTDTMRIHYTNQQQFVSVECGCTYHHDILTITTTHHWIDSIALEETTITRAGQTNIQIHHFSEK